MLEVYHVLKPNNAVNETEYRLCPLGTCLQKPRRVVRLHNILSEPQIMHTI